MKFVHIPADRCGAYSSVASTSTNTTDGTYTINGFPPGTYYLKARDFMGLNLLEEWWASPASVIDCSSAQSITVASEETVADVDFQLDPPATISGIVYESDGTTPVTGQSIWVYVYSGDPCGTYSSVASTSTNTTDGTYTINGLPPGAYYLKARDFMGLNLLDEWWASPASVIDCNSAQSITVASEETVPDVDFQLDTDSDSDGMADDWEIAYFGDLSQDGNADSDGDLLNDYDEFQFGTNPTNPDTDGDFISDHYEIYTGGTDPTNASSTPDLPIQVSVMNVHQPDDGLETYIHVTIDQGYTGALPGSIDSITVTAPGGATLCTQDDLMYYPQHRSFFTQLTGSPEIGTFTFTVTSGTLSGTATDTQSINRTIPLPDTGALSPANGATLTSKTPMFSWESVDYSETALYYQLVITDMDDNYIFTSSRQDGLRYCTVPVDILTAGQTYQWHVQIADSTDMYEIQNRANGESFTFTMDGTLNHSAQPAIDLDQWGAVIYSTATWHAFDFYVNIIDHDGVAYDGSSHVVTVTMPDATIYQMNFDGSESATVGSYYYGIDIGAEAPAPGVENITFTVTDVDGNTGTIIDTLTINPLAPPDESSFTPSNTNPVQEHITASFDNVYINGEPELYEDFSISSINELDDSKWQYPNTVGMSIQDQMLKISRSNCIGNCDSSLKFMNSDAIDTIQADITIDSVSSDVPSAWIHGIFYNNGTNDVLATLAVKENEVLYLVRELIVTSEIRSLNYLGGGDDHDDKSGRNRERFHFLGRRCLDIYCQRNRGHIYACRDHCAIK